jgi:hypothetical protein
MLGQKIRLPDIDPAIAQAEATAGAPLSSAFKAAAFSIGAMAFFVVLSADWSQLAKLGRSQSVEVSAAAPLEPIELP